MKKIISGIEALVAIIILTACGGGGGGTATSTNNAPVLSSIGNQTTAEDTAINIILSATDSDSGDTLIFSATSSAHITANVVGTTLMLTPDENWNGSENITVIVNDGTTTDGETFGVTVSAVNDAPTITGTPATSVNANSSYSFTPIVNDVDTGDTKTFSITNKPSWASFSTITGTLTGTPTNNDEGTTIDIVITVKDSANAEDSLNAFNIEVINTAPTFTSGSNVSVAENQTDAIDLNASDAEGSTPRYSISGTDAALFDINDSTGIVTFSSAPDYEHPMDENNDNNYEFNATVTDGNRNSTQNITISVTDINLSTVSLPIPQGTSLAYTTLTAHPDGSFYLSAYDSTNNIPYVVKLEENGSFDLSFGVNGFSDVSSVSSNGFEKGFVFDSFGNIYGISINGGIVKLNSNGSINLSFGTNGLYTLSNYLMFNIHIDENDWIYCVGAFIGNFQDKSDGFIIKMNIMGIRDNNFNSDGIVHFDYDGNDVYGTGTIAKESFYDLKIDSNGNIYAFGGVTEDASYFSSLMVKYTPSGLLSVDFNGSGIVIYRSTDSSSIFTRGYELTTDDKPLIIINDNSFNSIKLLRFTSLGILDSSFNGNGILNLAATEGLADLADISKGKTALDKFDNLYLNTTMDRTDTEGYFIAKVSKNASYNVVKDAYSHATKTLKYITINPVNDELFELTTDNFGTSYSVSQVSK